MGFVEGKIEEERLFGDVVFPKTLFPSNKGEDLASAVAKERNHLSEVVKEHGAILFRGFDVGSAEDFSRVVEAFGWDEMGYIGATTRLKMADRVFTANEAPIDQFINFHHEMALMKEFPSKIFFYCFEPAPVGGETSIVPSHVIVEKMEEQMPKVMEKLTDVGLILCVSTAKDEDEDSGQVISKTWKWLFKTDDKFEAEKRARQKLSCTSINFKDDGSAEFTYGPVHPVREFGGKKAWFLPILGYSANEKDVADTSFGDGSNVPQEAMDAYKGILEETCVDLKWKKGDVLLIDNLSVQHARRPGKPPRAIYASICK
ncbi:Clavaminate synthase-like protein [Acorus calamus]|uniref:Clavaminate synthase-like protein n=1 Tax=Acorus calamus TaxID=4465 RepID=A0AAV9DIQ4_ACOCL|nr:Clavaminate synthase-like protein [Acorus calamus]